MEPFRGVVDGLSGECSVTLYHAFGLVSRVLESFGKSVAQKKFLAKRRYGVYDSMGRIVTVNLIFCRRTVAERPWWKIICD